jgi:hypothetical protein
MQTKLRTWLDGETASVTSRDEDEGTQAMRKLEVGRSRERQKFEAELSRLIVSSIFPVSSDLIVLRRATLETRQAVTQDKMTGQSAR